MTKSKTKRDISRQTLESHGVYYCEDIYRPPNILPEHVDVVRETLLSFGKIVPAGGWEEALQNELKTYGSDGVDSWTFGPQESSLIPVEAYEADSNEKSPEWYAAKKTLGICKRVAETARELKEDSEDGWTLFWRTYTFGTVSAKACDQPGFNSVLDNWSLEGNFAWTEFSNVERYNPNLIPRTCPKPDLTYSFPILDPSIDNPKGFERDGFTRCFSAQSLGTLSRTGIICAPTTGLRKWTKGPKKAALSTTDRTCFPWAIVEFKKQVPRSHMTPVERCYCQAANASSAALELRTQLYARVFGHDYSEIPPVISFTCIGPVVKIWLTFLLELKPSGQRVYKMVCIWSTSVRLTWGVATLRVILMNMHTWASRLLKPKIQAWVFQALRIPHMIPQAKPHTPAIDHAISRMFNSPPVTTPSQVRTSARAAISPSMLSANQSPGHYSGIHSGTDMRSAVHPPSPLLTPTQARVPTHRMHLAVNRSSNRRSLATSDSFSDIPITSSTNWKLKQSVNESTKSQRDSFKMTLPNDQIDVDQIIESLRSSRLEDSAEGWVKHPSDKISLQQADETGASTIQQEGKESAEQLPLPSMHSRSNTASPGHSDVKNGPPNYVIFETTDAKSAQRQQNTQHLPKCRSGVFSQGPSTKSTIFDKLLERSQTAPTGPVPNLGSKAATNSHAANSPCLTSSPSQPTLFTSESNPPPFMHKQGAFDPFVFGRPAFTAPVIAANMASSSNSHSKISYQSWQSRAPMEPTTTPSFKQLSDPVLINQSPKHSFVSSTLGSTTSLRVGQEQSKVRTEENPSPSSSTHRRSTGTVSAFNVNLNELKFSGTSELSLSSDPFIPHIEHQLL